MVSHASKSGSIMVFDVDLITDSFKKCIENGLDLEQYNQGYNELYNFFNILGTVFGFIASDVREKIDILEKFRTDESSPSQKHYIKVEDMMLHEIKVDKEKKTELMGARTLLRLHRALDFTMQFLEKLNNLPVDGKVSTMAHEVYGKTLANFHPFFIRNAAKLAMYALPARSEFMKKVANPGVTDADINQAIKAGVEQMRAVYVAIEELYTKHDLHGLP